MNITRLIALAVGMLTVGIAALGWFLGISPILTTADTADRASAAQSADNAQQQAVLDALKVEFESIDESRGELALLQEEIPDQALTDSIAARIGEIAASTGVVVTNAAFSEPAVYGQGADTATATDAELAGVSPELAAQLFTVSITVTVTGDFERVLAFTDAMQHSTRLIIVDRATLQRLEGGGSADITGFGFIVATP